MLRDDLQAMDVSWEEAKSVAGDRKEWRSLVVQCSNGNSMGPKSMSQADVRRSIKLANFWAWFSFQRQSADEVVEP